MTIDEETRKQLVRYAACWGLLLLSLILFPLLSWPLLTSGLVPDGLGQLLFFWPQYLFVPNGMTHAASIGERTYADGSALYVAILFWAVVVALYVWSMRRVRSVVVYVGLIPAVYVVMQFGVYTLLALFGLGVVLDGP